MTDSEIEVLTTDVRNATALARLNISETKAVIRALDAIGFTLADSSDVKVRAAALDAAKAN